MNKTELWEEMERFSGDVFAVSDAVWDCPETAFLETGSAAILCGALEKAGFTVTKGLAGIPTAFQGVFGFGKPVIGILGEFDALSGLDQEAGATEKKAVCPGGAGHGCGHNLLGAASFGAALGLKKYLEETKIPGTVIYFGCPAEEGGSGKAFMAKEGIFAGLDAALTWHPHDLTMAVTGSHLANCQVSYQFYGTSSHAAASPHLGRSALDALELMNMGVQFLREHMIPDARIHYAITNTGGFSPNVVQPYAEVLYLIRAPKNSQVKELYERVNKIAEGAAHMTETRVKIDYTKGCSNLISNKVLAKQLWENLEELGTPAYSEEEMSFAKAIHDSIENNVYESLENAAARCEKAEKRELLSHRGEPVYRFLVPFDPDGPLVPASTDVGDVSWNCPTAEIFVTTWAAGTPAHSWQAVSQGKSSLAHTGLMRAAKAMAGTAVDLLADPSILSRAREEFEEELDGESYDCPILDGCRPRAIGMSQ